MKPNNLKACTLKDIFLHFSKFLGEKKNFKKYSINRSMCHFCSHGLSSTSDWAHKVFMFRKSHKKKTYCLCALCQTVLPLILHVCPSIATFIHICVFKQISYPSSNGNQNMHEKEHKETLASSMKVSIFPAVKSRFNVVSSSRYCVNKNSKGISPTVTHTLNEWNGGKAHLGWELAQQHHSEVFIFFFWRISLTTFQIRAKHRFISSWNTKCTLKFAMNCNQNWQNHKMWWQKTRNYWTTLKWNTRHILVASYWSTEENSWYHLERHLEKRYTKKIHKRVKWNDLTAFQKTGKNDWRVNKLTWRVSAERPWNCRWVIAELTASQPMFGPSPMHSCLHARVATPPPAGTPADSCVLTTTQETKVNPNNCWSMSQRCIMTS